MAISVRTTPASTGSVGDMLSRLKAVLPTRWFPDSSPILDGLLTGLAAAASTIYGMISYVRLQTRIATATDSFLDLAATDFCATRVSRAVNESDAVFRVRLAREMARTRATRQAIHDVLADVTGRTPTVFEPRRPADTGAYGFAGGYGVAGGWGSLSMPFQCLVIAYRPFSPNSPPWTGGPGPGAPAPGSPPVTLPVADTKIYAAVANVAPIAAKAWTSIAN